MTCKRDCIPVLALSLLMCACSRMSPEERIAEEKAIRESEVNWAIAWGALDLDRIVSHYAEDAVLMWPGKAAIRGKGAIREVLRRLMERGSPVVSFATSFVAVSQDGDMAYAKGTYSTTTAGAQTERFVIEKGRYLIVYRKQGDGVWRAEEDIRNADASGSPRLDPARDAP
jgi:uncharacterized protein (TIGR02246 family)